MFGICRGNFEWDAVFESCRLDRYWRKLEFFVNTISRQTYSTLSSLSTTDTGDKPVQCAFHFTLPPWKKFGSIKCTINMQVINALIRKISVTFNLYILTLLRIYSIPFTIRFLLHWQGEFVKQSSTFEGGNSFLSFND